MTPKRISVAARLSSILNGLRGPCEPSSMLIGKPVNDSNGKKVGTITRIDVENDYVYILLDDSAFILEFLRDQNSSCSLEVR